MIVMKFGGTSVQDASAMQKVAKIIKAQKSPQIIVVLSACAGVTNSLHTAIHLAAKENLTECYEEINKIETKHKQICEELFKNVKKRNEVITKIETILNELRNLAEGVNLLQECSPRSLDLALSKGEQISTLIFSEYLREINLKNELIDARKLIKTNSNYTNAHPIIKTTKEALLSTIPSAFERANLLITQGFIGADLENNTTTLGRGGSDYTASIIGALLDASEVQIWTDVPGILTADPKIVEDAKTIKQMSFREVKALSFLGAKVIHPKTILPAMKKNIPVKVLNATKLDEDNFTIINNKIQKEKAVINSIVLKKSCAVIKMMEYSRKNNALKKIAEAQLSKVIATINIFNSKLVIIDQYSPELINLLNETISNTAIEIIESDLICLTGENLFFSPQSQLLQMSNYKQNINSALIGINDNCLLLFAEKGTGETIVKYLHKKLYN